MADIKISTDAVRTTAASMRRLNGVLDGHLKDIATQMNNLKPGWQSDASDAIQAKFTAVANKYFEQYKEIIESYSKFLERVVAEGYETTETVNVSNADAFS